MRGVCSRKEKSAEKVDRTPDLMIFSHTLSQLSYLGYCSCSPPSLDNAVVALFTSSVRTASFIPSTTELNHPLHQTTQSLQTTHSLHP